MFLLKQLELPSTVLSLTNIQKDILMLMYKENNYKSRALPKILLTLARDLELKNLLENFIQKNLHGEVPALYQDICSLIRYLDIHVHILLFM
jgi:hypothetical protein